MFGIVFVWTPPHFWALALMIHEHYARANVPMLPVVRGDRETARQIVLYTVVLVAVDARSRRLRHRSGSSTASSALVLGAVFVVARRRAPARARRAARRAALPLLAALPRAALRRDGRRRGAVDPMDDRSREAELAARTCAGAGRSSASSGLLFGGTVAVALIVPLADAGRSRWPSCTALTARRLDGIFITELGAGEPGRGSRSRTSSTRRGCGRRTARPCSPSTCRRATAEAVRRARGGGLRRTSARRTCTSSPTASPRRTSTTASCRTRPRPGGRRAARRAARRRRSCSGSPTAALGTDTGGSIRIPAACCGDRGPQADVRARADRRRLSARAELRPRRADGPRRRRAASS